MPIPFILGILMAGGGGAFAGALARQPEINRLKEQVKQLQAEIKRLQLIVKEQDRQIRELKIRYNGLRAYHFTERARQKGHIKGVIMFQYCYKEYIELLVAQVHNDSSILKEEEKTFFNIFNKIINNQEACANEMVFLREYIRSGYSREIDSLTECNMETVLEKVERVNVA